MAACTGPWVVYAEAERAYEAAIRVRPVATFYQSLALVRFHLGDLDCALATVDSGMAALPAFNLGDGLKAVFVLARQDLAAADSLSRVFERTATGTRERRLSAEVRIWLAALGGKVRGAERVADKPDYADPITRASVRATLELMRGTPLRPWPACSVRSQSMKPTTECTPTPSTP